MAEKPTKKFKDWFDAEAVSRLGVQFHSAWPAFNRKRFQDLACEGLEDLEMSGRVFRMSEALAAVLPENRKQALQILADSLPPVLPDCEAVTDGWLQWPLGQFIADYGLEERDMAFEAMIELTQRFSSEFAIRPFVEHDPGDTFRRLKSLTSHSSPHVRRWCSEGIRPRLPWGGHLKELIRDPSPIWPILEDLKADPELYVRRSVANNLNDIAKDHPEAVLNRCESWWGAHPDTDALIRHALRTQIKNGDVRALALLGYSPPEHLTATLTVTPEQIHIGQSVTMDLTLQNTGTGSIPVMVDYGVAYVRKKGVSFKVFKWTTRTLEPGEPLELRKLHAMKETTIRALYPGMHEIRVQVNGQEVAKSQFELMP